MKRTHGFTLVEVVVVVAIIGVLATVAVFSLEGTRAAAELNGETRQLVGNLRSARTMAATRMEAPPPPPPPPPPPGPFVAALAAVVVGGPPPKVRSAGVRIIDAKSYEVFVDTNTGNGGEITMEIVQLPYDSQLRIVSPPPGTRIRFRNNGMRTNASADTIVIRDDQVGKEHTIRVNLAGTATIE